MGFYPQNVFKISKLPFILRGPFFINSKTEMPKIQVELMTFAD
jgi:hypothetical protein